MISINNLPIRRTLMRLATNKTLLRNVATRNLILSSKLTTRKYYSTPSSSVSDTSNITNSAPNSIPITKSKDSPLLDFSKTKVKNQQFSENNDLPLFIAITKRASEKLNEIAKEDNDPNTALRVKVESGGCHGFQYLLNLTNAQEFNPDEGDSLFTREGASVIIDRMSLEILRDSKIDYVDELIGSQFKVVDSPYTTSSCGCGSSFDFDFEKLSADAESK